MQDFINNMSPLLINIIRALIIAFSFLMGLFLIFRPEDAIELQKKFYVLINWRIEPISMKREIRSTKNMGILLFLCVVAAIIYSILY